ncbi:prephenate dehydrogenase/arogenate dehydrogenase family protein [Alicyclobacillus mali]|uniref:Prephenate dehydrogenase/arogenate dehydrogenase family protein n=1 Tax=Alicyclobacillus mali (ex Roth et al. 2021) TaxID=1123961 RepID=A0ABS0F2E2_9BACL|nr:prephenate dehydrogenase/arogenate dehydrogenase family protein [Alicyclobacillus mali (ex Roth et al. 2021)]MBF8377460.1 prephenate dehydrogenase/arogenate dehydrogenase family protein [Alicyclobacillus mali (ex Roth et al. 2021)]MCL6487428.1 prephenate dehydrogenase/arogenate dehydrogenase family protein [Alicyclobacillus mali (ex Roth et al. 2021)]
MALKRVLIVGAGLIGGSMGLALSRRMPHLEVDAVEQNAVYREQAGRLGAFARVWHALESAPSDYDLAVLAVPVDAAVQMLPRVRGKATRVMDVCSVKRPIVQAMDRVLTGSRGVPSHPMAGKAQAGPLAAEESLFEKRPWLFLETHRPPEEVLHLVERVGARTVWVPDAEAHDRRMAEVSHGIHLASQCAILAAESAPDALAEMAGPAFWDVTRLASSPSEFWIQTLAANRDHVISWLRRFEAAAQAFRATLEREDEAELNMLLDEARRRRKRAEAARNTE